MRGRGMVEVVVGLLLSAAACGGRNEAAPAGHGAGSVSTGGSTGAGPVAGGQAPAVDGGVPGSPTTPTMSPPARTCPTAPPPGATWTDVPPPAGLPAGFFATDAWSAGPDEFFFVGADPADALGDPSAIRRVLHWSGGCWTIELAVTGGLNAPAQISGTSPNDVWITTGDTIYHRDSSGWSPAAQLNAALAPAPGNVLILEDVQARTPDDVWFTSSAIVHFLNGQVTMTQIPAPPPLDPAVPPITFAYSAISILGENDVWVGGTAEQNANTMPPAVLFHFDGQSWTVHGPVGPIAVEALWPAGPSDALWVAVAAAAGQAFPIVAFANDTVTQTTIANWEMGAGVISLWGRAPNDIWAAGTDIAHFDGTSWSQVADAPASVRDNTDATVFDNAVVVGDATTTWVTNAGPVFVRKAAGTSP